MAEKTEERLSGEVVVCLDTFDLDVAVQPYHGVNPLLAIRRAAAHPVAHIACLTGDFQLV
jgi:hypothetical protein